MIKSLAQPSLLAFCTLVVACFGSPQALFGQEWVKDMFVEVDHDFGTVPRGANAEFEFKLTNKYEEDVRIASVRSSCGCTIPRIKGKKQTLKTYEDGAIVCEFNTRSFIGPKSAVVTVVFTAPFYGEMQLNVKGNIRSDIVTEPGVIEFGEVARGEEKESKVRVSYAGTKAWQITDVRSANQNLGVKLTEMANGGRKAYEMSVRLKKSAPAGSFSDQIVLVTNDPQYNLVTIPVRGNVLRPLQATAVNLGSVKTGGEVTSRLVIRSRTPFEVKDVSCKDDRFQFTLPKGKRSAHLIPIVFKAGDDVAAFRKKITITTDLPEENVVTTEITGNVVGNN